jgi:hypothetical protein
MEPVPESLLLESLPMSLQLVVIAGQDKGSRFHAAI